MEENWGWHKPDRHYGDAFPRWRCVSVPVQYNLDIWPFWPKFKWVWWIQANPSAPESCHYSQSHSRGACCTTKADVHQMHQQSNFWVVQDVVVHLCNIWWAKKTSISHTKLCMQAHCCVLNFNNFSLLFLLYVWFYCLMTWKYFIIPF